MNERKMPILLNVANPSQGEPAGAVYAMPAAPLQVRLWNLGRLTSPDPSWNVAVRFMLSGPLDREVLEASLQGLCDLHEVLRAVLAEHSGDVVQQISSRVTLPVEWCDLRSLDGEAQASEVLRLSLDHARQTLSLHSAPMWRVRVLRLEENLHCLLWNLSHAVCDGWSVGLLAQDLMRAYEERLAGRTVTSENSLDYGDYAVWLDAERRTPKYEVHRQYWSRQLRSIRSMPLPASWRNREPLPAHSVLQSRLLPRRLTERLGEVAQRHGATFFHAALTAFALQLRGEQESPEVTLGTPVSGRDQAELEGVVGTFINYVPLRLQIEVERPFSEVLESVRDSVIGPLEHAAYRIEDMLTDLGSAETPAPESRLFSAVFICQRDFVRPAVSDGLTLTALPSVSAGALRPLTVFMVEREEGWRLSCEVDNRTVSAAAGTELLEDLEHLMDTAAASPEKALPLTARSPVSAADSTGESGVLEPVLPSRIASVSAGLNAGHREEPTGAAAGLAERKVLASEAQQRFFLLDQLNPGDTSFDLTIRLEMRGPLEVDALRSAAEMLVERHEILRTTFVEEGEDRVWQIIHPAGILDFRSSQSESSSPDLSVLEDGESENFSLTDGPLFRMRVVQLEPECHWLSIVLSHAIADGWSGGLFLEELRQAYESCLSGRRQLAQRPVQFSVYSESEHALMEGPESGRRLDWWRQHLQGKWERLALPRDVDASRQAAATQAETSSTVLAPSAVISIRRFARECDATPFAVFGAAFQALLARYSHQQDILFLTPFANRDEQTESVIGPLAIPVCLTGHVADNTTFRGLVTKLSTTSTAAMEHVLPFSAVAPLLNIRVESGHHALNQVTFFHQRAFVHEMQWGAVAVKPLPEYHAATGSEWQLGVVERQEGISVEFLYQPASYSVQTMSLVGQHYARLLTSAVMNPDLPLSQLQFVTAEEISAQSSGRPLLPVTRCLISPAEGASLPTVQSAGPQAVELEPNSEGSELSESEREMVKIWQPLFKKVALSPESDFFDLGGHSLLLARLQIALKKNFNVQLSAADVFRRPTLGALAAWLERARSSGESTSAKLRSNPRIIPIQPHGEGHPIFVISQSMIFRMLAAELGESQPVYALQMLDEDITPELEAADYDRLVDYYVRLIREVQPSGPYRLAGWCVSGWIGYGIARRLEREGETIELLMIMDAWAPGYWIGQPWARRMLMRGTYRFQRLRWVGRRLRQSSHAERSLYISRSLHGMAAAAARNLSVFLHRLNFPVRVRLTEEMRRSEQLEYIASRAFDTGQLQGNVLLFRSEEQPAGPLLAPDMGWSGLLGRPVTVKQLPGDHQEIFDPAGARIMAAAARKVLGMPPVPVIDDGGATPSSSASGRRPGPVPMVEA